MSMRAPGVISPAGQQGVARVALQTPHRTHVPTELGHGAGAGLGEVAVVVAEDGAIGEAAVDKTSAGVETGTHDSHAFISVFRNQNFKFMFHYILQRNDFNSCPAL